MHSLHLPGDVLSFEHWKGPKKLHGLGHLWRETAAEITIEHNNPVPIASVRADYERKPHRNVLVRRHPGASAGALKVWL